MVRTPLSLKRSLTSRLAIGGAIAATTAVIGVAGVAAAAPSTDSSGTPAIVKMCKDPNFRKAHGFKNVGDCVSTMMHQQKGSGNGYGNGNGNTVNSDVNVTVNGNNNVISVIQSFIFG
jgi:hypothetical protein